MFNFHESTVRVVDSSTSPGLVLQKKFREGQDILDFYKKIGQTMKYSSSRKLVIVIEIQRLYFYLSDREGNE